ncbi:MAG TPA: hypothetical protein ENH98_03145 [archaeon]|nr:hypothetical protein [archaeon]
MDQLQFNTYSSMRVFSGTFITKDQASTGIFTPQYESIWYFLFFKPESGCVILTYDIHLVPFIRITSPTTSTRVLTESQLKITWVDNLNEWLKIELYKGSSYVKTLGNNIFNDGAAWITIPDSLDDGSDYKIKVTGKSTGEFDYSDPFTIIKRKITLYQPKSSDVFIPHTLRRIEWIGTGIGEDIKIDLFLNSSPILNITSQTNTSLQYFWWYVWQGSNYSKLTQSTYQIRIQDIINPKYTVFSPNFTITNEKHLSVKAPIKNAPYKAGSTMNILWSTDSPFDTVLIELYKGGVFQQKVVNARNSGSFNWTIPSSLKGASNYYISIRTTDNGTIGESPLFTIVPVIILMDFQPTLLFTSIILIAIAIGYLWWKK